MPVEAFRVRRYFVLLHQGGVLGFRVRMGYGMGPLQA